MRAEKLAEVVRTDKDLTFGKLRWCRYDNSSQPFQNHRIFGTQYITCGDKAKLLELNVYMEWSINGCSVYREYLDEG